MVDVAVGSHASKGQKILVMEAMKMEIGLVAPFEGIVEFLAAAAGDQVREGDVLIRIAKAG
jgi:3-methylcrotonyl-CoA carboxylase alpha subunit